MTFSPTTPTPEYAPEPSVYRDHMGDTRYAVGNLTAKANKITFQGIDRLMRQAPSSR